MKIDEKMVPAFVLVPWLVWLGLARLVGALLLEQNDEWAVRWARYMTQETMAQMVEDAVISPPVIAS